MISCSSTWFICLDGKWLFRGSKHIFISGKMRLNQGVASRQSKPLCVYDKYQRAPQREVMWCFKKEPGSQRARQFIPKTQYGVLRVFEFFRLLSTFRLFFHVFQRFPPYFPRFSTLFFQHFSTFFSKTFLPTFCTHLLKYKSKYSASTDQS